MNLKERLSSDIAYSLQELAERAKRLPQMDDHSIRTFANLLVQAAKEASMLSGIADFEAEQKRNK